MLTKTVRRVVALSLFVAVIVLFRYLEVGRYLTLERVQEYSLYLREYVDNYYVQSVIAYIFVYFFAIACALPASAVMTLLGGFLFGTIPGALYANIAATSGSIISFLLFKYVLSPFVKDRYAEQLKPFKKHIREEGYWYLLTLHFLSVIPFFVINALAALADVPLWTFVWTTAVGFIPLSLVYGFAGKQLGKLKSVGDIFSPGIIIALVLLIVLSTLPTIIKWLKRSRWLKGT